MKKILTAWGLGLVLLLFSIVTGAKAQVFEDDFSTDVSIDTAKTTAQDREGSYVLKAFKKQYGHIGQTDAVTISSSGNDAYSVITADMDGDGDLDVVEGIYGQRNKLYLNNGTATPFAGVNPQDIGTASNYTTVLLAEDFDMDGDLDLAEGNIGKNYIYYNNGSATPFVGVSASALGSEEDSTRSLATFYATTIDRDPSIVVGNSGQSNKLYYNLAMTHFEGVDGVEIDGVADQTFAVRVVDLNGDGQTDLVVGNSLGGNKYYIRASNITASFEGLTGGTLYDSGTMETYAIEVADMDGDGDMDIVAGNYGQFNKLYLNNGTDNPFNMVPPLTIGTEADQTQAITLDDMDGDGDMDVIAGSGSASENDRLYLNNGTSDPFAGVDSVALGDLSRKTRAIAVGDLDGDGTPDIITGGSGTDTEYIPMTPVLSTAAQEITASAYQTRSIALGDMDGDGDLDLVAGDTGRVNQLVFNNGTADPFDSAATADIGTALATKAVAVADMDRDGDLDVLEAMGNTQSVKLYLNNGTTDPFNGVSGKDIDAAGGYTTSIAVADMDGDGDPDLVEGNFGTLSRVVFNNGTPDPFSDHNSSDFTANAAAGVSAMAVADLDGDGDMDIICATSLGDVDIYRNNGTMDPFNGIASAPATGGLSNAHTIQVGDVDRDGHLDVVIGYPYETRLYLNNGSTNPFTGVTPQVIGAGKPDIGTSTALADLNGDGYLDIIEVNNFDSVNRVYLNNGTADPFDSVTSTVLDPTTGDHYAVAVGDVNRDGSRDIVIARGGETNLFYPGSVTTLPVQTFASEFIGSSVATTYGMHAVDMDRDGNLDIMVCNSSISLLYRGDGQGGLSSGLGVSATGNYTTSHAIADFNGDGLLDVVMGNHGKTNKLYLNNGTSNPFSGVTAKVLDSTEDHTRAVLAVDIDRDGDMDVVAAHDDKVNTYYLNNGTADPFSDQDARALSGPGLKAYGLAVADMNKDGYPDILIANNGEQNIALYHTGTIYPYDDLHYVEIGTDQDNSYDITAADMDNDGDMDVVVANYGQVNKLYFNDGDGYAIDFTPIGSETDKTWSVRTVDVNGDGYLDVITANEDGTNKVYLNNGTATPFDTNTTATAIGSQVENTRGIAAADMDNDGVVEFLIGNYNEKNRIMKSSAFVPHTSRIVSGNLNSSGSALSQAYIESNITLPYSTSARYFMSNNGGADWIRVPYANQLAMTFATSGSDLRYMIELDTFSPILTPEVHSVLVTTAPTLEASSVDATEDTLFTFSDATFQDAAQAPENLEWIKITQLPSKGTLKFDGTDVTLGTLYYTQTGRNPSSLVDLGKLTYTPEADDYGSVNFKWSAASYPGRTASATSATMTINIAPVDDGAPVLAPLADVNKSEDSAAFNVTLSATDVDNEPITYSAVSGNTGIATVAVSGTTLTVTPVANANGSVVITASAEASGAVTDQSFTLTLAPVADAPVLAAISDVTKAEDAAAFNVTLSAVDADGDAITYSAVSTDTDKATVSVSGNTLTIMPVADATGDVMITVTASDGVGSDSTSFSLILTGVDDAPVLSVPSDIVKDEDSAAFDIVLSATDLEGDAITFNAYSGDTAKATTSISGNTLTVSPQADAVGEVEITVIATASGLSDTASFTLALTNVDDAPVLAALADVTRLEDSPAFTVDLSALDVDGDAITYSAVSADTGKATVSLSGTTLTVTPLPNAQGDVVITVTASAGGQSDTQAFTLKLTGLDDAPVLSAIGNIVKDEESAPFDITLSATDVEGDAITYSALSGNTDKATVSVSGETLTVTPQHDAVGDVTITVTATAGSLSDTESFTLTLNNVDDAPFFPVLGNMSKTEDGESFDVVLNAMDIDGDAIVYSALSSDAAKAAVSVAGNLLTVTPKPDATGDVNITVTATANGVAVVQSFILTLNPVDDAPVLFSLVDMTKPEDSAAFDITLVAEDADNDPISFAAESSDTSVATVSVSGNTLTVTPQADAVGMTLITVTATAAGVSDTQTFRLSVTSVDDGGPVLEALGNITKEQDSAPFTVVLNATDPDGDAITFSAESSDTGIATVSVSGNILTVTPQPGASGKVSVTVTATANGSSDQVAFILTVNAAGVSVSSGTTMTNEGDATVYHYTGGSGMDITVTVYDDGKTLFNVLGSDSNLSFASDLNLSSVIIDANGTVTANAVFENDGVLTEIAFTIGADGSVQYTLTVDGERVGTLNAEELETVTASLGSDGTFNARTSQGDHQVDLRTTPEGVTHVTAGETGTVRLPALDKGAEVDVGQIDGKPEITVIMDLKERMEF